MDLITPAQAVATPLPCRRCDERYKSGKRAKKQCTAPASLFHPILGLNLCGLHDKVGAIRGVGTPWYADLEFGCDVNEHADRPMFRICKGVRMCNECSRLAERNDCAEFSEVA